MGRARSARPIGTVVGACEARAPFVCGVNVGDLLCGTSIASIESVESIKSIESIRVCRVFRLYRIYRVYTDYSVYTVYTVYRDYRIYRIVRITHNILRSKHTSNYPSVTLISGDSH